MKQQIIFIAVLLLFCRLHATAQTYEFYYLDRPAAITANFNNSNASPEPGLNEVLIDASNVAKFRSVAPANLVSVYNKLTSASALKRSADRITSVSNHTVTLIKFWLVNDATSLPAGGGNYVCKKYSSALNREIAWPCASNVGTYGLVRFGEIAASRGDFESVVLHEISHTQRLSDPTGLNSSFGRTNRHVSIAYGGDKSHLFEELQGDQQSPMDEGLGNFWGGVHDATWRTNHISIFSQRDFFLGSHSVLTGTPAIWDAPHTVLVDVTVPPRVGTNKYPIITAGGYTLEIEDSLLTPNRSRYMARLYRFCNVPGQFTFNSELLPEMFLYMYHQYAFQTMDKGMESIMRFIKYYSLSTPYQKHRYPFSMAMFLAADMETYRQAGGTVPNEQFVSSIFPLALYDLLTHFGMTDAELDRVFNISTYNNAGLPNIVKSQAYLKYLSVRNQVKTALLPVLYNNANCADAATTLDINKAAAALKDYCILQETLDLTKQ